MEQRLNTHFVFLLLIEATVGPTCVDGLIPRNPLEPHVDLLNGERNEQEYYHSISPDSEPYKPVKDGPGVGPSQPASKPAGDAGQCVRCCDPVGYPSSRRHQRYNFYSRDPPEFQAIPQINLTILKGDKGDSGERGSYGQNGKSGGLGPRGPAGAKGFKGNTGRTGDPCKLYYSAFSVGRKKELHSNDYYQTLIFDTEYVNLYNHFNMFTGKFYCFVPGIYHFNLNVHTWNQKETYMHIMKNMQEMVILYSQPSDRSIMQSQSIMMDLKKDDEVWIRLYKGERANAIFSDGFDMYITFNGYLIKAASEI
ncbi:complement C1q tumor necrosis factor-related protein 1 [Callorhinchus milii]|uniref:C1q and TNF related 1 n=1 Tax=Callorhinchus milii TaxID=7868 RepID=V9L1K2_CALMI|nr:complement C1q tumor necrosis factor-related protein 1 [Callorhinchus milii]XP_007886724.1 complement C1q tumor necrosis factor-related protein 1 [Callorhinchus milii]XP_042198330.1 complement C1q tumor necrosis factor-related protein 1 [Callorhinchus milii]XP_042198331.1 complement C1q tumor necrosis factor-related protein 1 [Callorhinchus milii]|eukprot:gi/632942996/ref/XP_007886723.1/ PREDICTED: complement C1q tumor necrosis factor-related protein 1 [Callorhinchus milii]